MRTITHLASSLLALGGFCIANASGEVYFSDDFELQPINAPGTAIQPPPIGLPYYYNPSLGYDAVNIVTAPLPVIGTKSLETFRNETAGPDVIATSLDGALVDGKTLEVRWSHNASGGTGHTFNAPMQNSIGYSNGLIGQLAFITINDTTGHNGEYHYTDAFGSYATPTGLKATLNGWDSLRVVMTLQSYDATYMTGTYDLFISLNGAPEVQAANDVSLLYAQKATESDANGGLTSAWFRMQKGPSAANSYYDNLYIGDPIVAPAATTWNVDDNGNWSLGSNWDPATAPNGVGATVNFGSKITAAKTVTLDSPQTVGVINFDNTNSYTIAGTSTLTIDVSSGGGAINVLAGSHSIAAPVVLADDTTVVVAAGQTLSVQHLRGAGLTVNSGTVKMIAGGSPNAAAGTSKLTAVSVASGAVLDLTNNSLVIDYTGTSVQESVRQALADGRLTTSMADANKKLGYGEASVTGFANGTFAGQSVDADAVLVKFTYGGDSNLDGKVDVGDLGNLASNWQQSAPWTGGDFDYNGSVNVGDLGILATNWQQGVTTPTLGPSFQEALAALGLGGASVPEPALVALFGVCSAFLVRSRRSLSRSTVGPSRLITHLAYGE